MQNYKISVSKNGKKYTIVLKAETEKLARSKVHDEGYSILSIEKKIEGKENIGNIFMFTVITKGGDLKKGKIVGDDLFKAYIKLKKDLNYNVIELFYEKEANKLNENQKKVIVNDLKEEYELTFNKKNTKEKKQVEEKVEVYKEKKLENFYLKKELTEIYKLIDFILIKIEKLLSGTSGINIELDQKEKLKTIYNSIIKIKKTTNIAKLKIIGELALVKVGKIELDNIENKHEEKSKELLKETNSLLRKIGSKESFIEKDKDIGYIISNFFSKISNFLSLIFKKKKKEEIDKHTHSYVKNILFLKRYKEKLKENNIFILKNIIRLLFNNELKIDTFVRRRVLKQNILLLKIKNKGISYSYTYIKKGINNMVKFGFNYIIKIKEYLFGVIFIYLILFLGLLNINYYFNLYNSNYQGIFYFIVIFLIYLILSIYKNLILIVLNFVILFFIVIFGVVNF